MFSMVSTDGGWPTLAVFEIGFCWQQNNSGCPTLCGFQSVGAWGHEFVDFFLPTAPCVNNSKISRGKHLISPPFPKSRKSGAAVFGERARKIKTKGRPAPEAMGPAC